jgi:hypothetical protein
MDGLMRAATLTVLVWSAHFGVSYGFTALACARQLSSVVPWVIGAASVAALAALMALAVPAGVRAARRSELPDFLAVGLAGLAAIAVIWEASPVLWISACG